MRKLTAITAIALAAMLSACSHGGNDNTLPGNQHTSGSDLIRQKQLREEQRIPSTFVAPKHPGFVAETPEAQTWKSGISEAGEAPVPGGMFVMLNQYNTTENGRHVTVYAGSRKSTHEGVVLVVTRSADLHTATAQTFTVASGPVRIQSATDGQLQLQTVGEPAARNIQFRVPL
jgi:hypothetical protein